MAPTVYQDIMSPPVQAVALTVRAAGLESSVHFQDVSLLAGDHMQPEFVKKFPLHTVPALEDDGFYLWESAAICAYIISAYGVDDKLYPKDPKTRAKVDQYLHFSNSTLYSRVRAMAEPLWKRQTKIVPEAAVQRVRDAVHSLDIVLEDRQWLVGDGPTIADICCVCEVNGAQNLTGDFSELKNVSAWLKRCQVTLPGFDDIAMKGRAVNKARFEEFQSTPNVNVLLK